MIIQTCVDSEATPIIEPCIGLMEKQGNLQTKELKIAIIYGC